MPVYELLACLNYVKEDLKVREVKPDCVYFEHTPQMFERKKLIDNYVLIINGEKPKHYIELYQGV